MTVYHNNPMYSYENLESMSDDVLRMVRRDVLHTIQDRGDFAWTRELLYQIDVIQADRLLQREIKRGYQ